MRISKSAVQVAQEALAAGRAALPEYGSRYSRRDYTQPQLFALLVLRGFLRTDYRGVVTLLAEWSELRRTLGLAKVPHYSMSLPRWRGRVRNSALTKAGFSRVGLARS